MTSEQQLELYNLQYQINYYTNRLNKLNRFDFISGQATVIFSFYPGPDASQYNLFETGFSLAHSSNSPVDAEAKILEKATATIKAELIGLISILTNELEIKKGSFLDN